MMVTRWKASERQMFGYGLECGRRQARLPGLARKAYRYQPTKLGYATERLPPQKLSYDAAIIQSFKSVVA